jgi:hypothetical protein
MHTPTHNQPTNQPGEQPIRVSIWTFASVWLSLHYLICLLGSACVTLYHWICIAAYVKQIHRERTHTTNRPANQPNTPPNMLLPIVVGSVWQHLYDWRCTRQSCESIDSVLLHIYRWVCEEGGEKRERARAKRKQIHQPDTLPSGLFPT